MSATPTSPTDSGHNAIRENEVLLHRGALRANVLHLRARAGAPLCAVVKANGYGLGGREVGSVLTRAGVEQLAVATVEEAIALRDAGVAVPIFILGGAAWTRHPERLVEVPDLVPLLHSVDEIRDLKRRLPPGAQLSAHLAVDTGMSREGIYVGEDVGAAMRAVQSALDAPGASLRVEGIMTHFANADLSDEAGTAAQMQRFASAVGAASEVLQSLRIVHVSNSAATLAHGARFGPLNDAAFDRFTFWARPGFALYGTTPFPDGQHQDALRPAFSWRAPIVGRKRVAAGTPVSYGSTFVCRRETELAVLGLGYADGYHRMLSGRGQVKIGAHDAPILGRVCMDLCIADVTDIVAAGDAAHCALHAPAVVLGHGAALSGWAAATLAETIPYELMTSIAARVHRRVVDTWST